MYRKNELAIKWPILKTKLVLQENDSTVIRPVTIYKEVSSPILDHSQNIAHLKPHVTIGDTIPPSLQGPRMSRFVTLFGPS